MGEQESDKFNFPLEEEKILDFWNEIKAFQECLNQSKKKPRFVILIVGNTAVVVLA